MDKWEIQEELRARAEDIRQEKSGRWVPYAPEDRGTQCAVYVHPLDTYSCQKTLSEEALQAIDDYILQLEELRPFWGAKSSIVGFNDHMAKDRFEVADLMDKTAANL